MVFAMIFSSVRIHMVETTSAGTIDFVSRVKRDSHAHASLLRAERKTARSLSIRSTNQRSASHYAHFIFAGDNQKEIKKTVTIPTKPDPAVQEFVRAIEKANPHVNTATFWAWNNEA